MGNQKMASGVSSEIRRQLEKNLSRVRERIEAAARRADRSPNEITLIVVTKYVVPEVIPALVDAGYQILAESRPQELWRKAEFARPLPIRWHLVGPLQRNKAKKTVPLVELIHSVDSIALLETLDTLGKNLSRKVPVLLEVNISGESAKHGFSPEHMPEVVEQLTRFPHVEVRGLMGMAGLQGGLEAARRQFAFLRELRDHLQKSAPQGVELRELSMGMSGDFEVAIEEGATMVRLGSILFEGLPPECLRQG